MACCQRVEFHFRGGLTMSTRHQFDTLNQRISREIFISRPWWHRWVEYALTVGFFIGLLALMLSYFDVLFY